jgi:pimeloyl-ACP methyl ester carboxylesterase
LDADVELHPRSHRVALPPPAGPGEVAFYDYGPPDRPPDVVFLHATGFNARAYRTILSPLATRLRMITPDQRGHGASTLATDRLRTSWLDFRDDLLSFLDALGVERTVLAGHSMGGTVSLLAAAAAPDRVKALALFDPVIRSPDQPRRDPSADVRASPMVAGAAKRRRAFPSKAVAMESYRGRGAFRTWTEAQLADYVAAGFHEAADGGVELACTPEWEVSNYVNQDHDSWAAFAASRCPIHLLRAADNSPGRIEGNLDQLAATGRIRIETIAGTTHFLPMERPDLVRTALLEAVEAP